MKQHLLYIKLFEGKFSIHCKILLVKYFKSLNFIDNNIIQYIKKLVEFINANPTGEINVKNQELIFGGFNDLSLSLHGTTLNVSGNLVDGKGNLNIVITDCYDFKYEEGYGDGLKDTFVTGYNNIAWKWQNIGTITPYNIIIQFDYEIK